MFKSIIWSVLALFLFAAPIFADTETSGEAEEVGMIKVTIIKNQGIDGYTIVDTNGVEFVSGNEVADGTVLFITPHITQSEKVVYKMTTLDPNWIVSKVGSTTYSSRLPSTLNKETGVYRLEIKSHYSGAIYPVEISASVEAFVDISTNIEGEGSVEIVEEGRSHETLEVDGKKYYNSRYEYTFNVTPGEGYYFSSAKVHGKDGVYVGTTVQDNRVTQFKVSAQATHFTMDVVFKESSNEIVNNIDSRCSATDLPATANFGEEVVFKVECNSDDIKLGGVLYYCEEKFYNATDKGDGTYSFVKKDCGMSVKANLLYKVEVVDEGESGVGDFEKKVDYIRGSYTAWIYAIYPDLNDLMRYFDYSYELNGEQLGGSVNFERTCNDKEGCFYTSFKMPEAPVTVKIFRREVSSSSVQESSSSAAESSSSVTASSSSAVMSSSSSEVVESSSSFVEVASSSSKPEDSSSSSAVVSSSSAIESSSSSEESGEMETTSIAAVQFSSFKIGVMGRSLKIESARKGESYVIMDLQGRVLNSDRLASASQEIVLPRAGRYLVRIAGQVLPIAVK